MKKKDKLTISDSKQSAQSICLLRLSAIGDVCNALAIAQEIRRQRPNSTLTWIIGKTEYALLKTVSDIEFIVFDKRAGLSAYLKLWKQLKNRKFDVLLHMQTAIRASLLSLMVRATIRIGFDRSRARELQWLFCNKKVAAQNKPHVLDGFMSFTQALGLKDYQPQWHFPIPETYERWAKFITGQQTYILLSPCASNPERNWSVNKYQELVSKLTATGFNLVLTTGPNEKEIDFARKIYQGNERKIVNLAGSTNLVELLALIKNALFVISPDSGPVHMSVMIGTPIIGVYAHSNPLRTGPWRYRNYVVSHYESNIYQQHGKPSSQLAWGKRAKGSSLMENIQVDEVITKVKELFNNELRE